MAELTMHAGQKRVFMSKKRFKVVVAGRRWGKTQTAKIAIITRATKAKQLIWYVAPTYQMARSIMWNDLKESFPREWVVKINETRMSIELRNGSRIELKGADKPDTLRGVGLHYLVMDEIQDMKEETWSQVLRPTLASTRGEALFIGTPKSFNWLYSLYLLGQRGEVYLDKKGKPQRNHWESWQFPTITSPFIPKSEIEQARADMDEKSFKQEFEASFEVMSGRVYYAFERREHVKNLKFNPKLPIWIGMDFNIDPMSMVVMQPQPNGQVWVVDEIILFGSNTQESVEEISRRYWKQQRQATFYPDPAGGQRGHARGESDLDIIREAGFRRIKFRRKAPRVADRVNAVNRMFKAGDGAVKMLVDPKCKHLINALEQTIYKAGSREVDKSAGIEHPADGLGYCVDIEFPVREVTVRGVSL